MQPHRFFCRTIDSNCPVKKTGKHYWSQPQQTYQHTKKKKEAAIFQTLEEEMWNIPIFDWSNCENELNIPVFYIHSLNENPSL